MNYLEELKWLIEENWQQTRTERDQNLPEPQIEIDRDVQEQDLGTQDWVIIEERTGGDHLWSLNQQKKKEFYASILVRSGDRTIQGSHVSGSDRVYGIFDEDDRGQEQYGGMTGEVEAILDNEIDGGPNFDLINPDSGWERVESAYGIWAARLNLDLHRTEVR